MTAAELRDKIERAWREAPLVDANCILQLHLADENGYLRDEKGQPTTVERAVGVVGFAGRRPACVSKKRLAARVRRLVERGRNGPCA